MEHTTGTGGTQCTNCTSHRHSHRSTHKGTDTSNFHQRTVATTVTHRQTKVTKYFDLVKLNGKQAQNTQQVHSTQVAQGTASVTDGVHEALMPV